MKQIKIWEIWGAVISIAFGSALHFVFGWSGGNRLIALFGAVNESTWEHLKIAFWPTFIFAFIEWLVWGKKLKNFCLATFVKLITIPVIIMVLFYGWLAFSPDNFIWDISIFVLAIIVGYILSYKILQIKKTYCSETIWALLVLIILLTFSLFTYFPPKIFLFQDPVNGGYGIKH